MGGIYPNAGYWKDAENRVYLRGMVSGGTGIIFNLPADYRPPFDQRFTINAAAAPAGISVTQSGNVILQYGATTLVDLGTVRFLNH